MNNQNANPNGNGYSYGWNKLFRRIVKTYCAVENASVGQINSQVIALADITKANLNLWYPDMTVMGKVVFTNVTGTTPNVIVATRITAGELGNWTTETLIAAV